MRRVGHERALRVDEHPETRRHLVDPFGERSHLGRTLVGVRAGGEIPGREAVGDALEIAHRPRYRTRQDVSDAGDCQQHDATQRSQRQPVAPYARVDLGRGEGDPHRAEQLAR